MLVPRFLVETAAAASLEKMAKTLNENGGVMPFTAPAEASKQLKAWLKQVARVVEEQDKTMSTDEATPAKKEKKTKTLKHKRKKAASKPVSKMDTPAMRATSSHEPDLVASSSDESMRADSSSDTESDSSGGAATSGLGVDPNESTLGAEGEPEINIDMEDLPADSNQRPADPELDPTKMGAWLEAVWGGPGAGKSICMFAIGMLKAVRGGWKYFHISPNRVATQNSGNTARDLVIAGHEKEVIYAKTSRQVEPITGLSQDAPAAIIVNEALQIPKFRQQWEGKMPS